MPEQLADVGDSVLDHRRPLQAQTPRNYAHILWDSPEDDDGTQRVATEKELIKHNEIFVTENSTFSRLLDKTTHVRHENAQKTTERLPLEPHPKEHEIG